MSTLTRRSTRQRKPNTRYSGTDWDRATLRALRESDQSSGSSPSNSDDDGARQDQKFSSRRRRSEVAVRSTDDEVSSHASPESAVHTPGEQSEIDLKAIRWGADGQPRYMDGTVVADRKRSSKHKSSPHFQGIRPLHKASRDWTYQAFGSDLQDLEPILIARETWLEGRDITLPSKLSLADSFFDHDSRKHLILRYGPPKSASARNQTPDVVEPSASGTSKPVTRQGPVHSLVLGPIGKQHLHKVDYLQALDVSEVWHQTSSAYQFASTPSTPTTYDRGWILNVGQKVQSMSWLSSNDEKLQFLAVSAQAGQTAPASSLNTISPAIPSPNAQASPFVQIWAFRSSYEDDGDHVASYQSVPKAPRLHSIHPVDADVHHLQWQPRPSNSERQRIAMLTSEGTVRLLNIKLFKPNEDLQISELESQGEIIGHSSKSLYKAMSWLSESDLILGDSEGKIHIFNIKPSVAEPYLSLHLHNTSISSITASQAAEIPTMIVTCSTSGDILFTDLRAPSQDTVIIRNSSPTKSSAVYCPIARSFITATHSTDTSNDQNTSSSVIRCHHLRHFSHPLPICHLPQSSGKRITLACSPRHPCILIGTEKGAVYATNYLRTALQMPTIKRAERTGGYLQKIFEYDWRALSAEEQEANTKQQGNREQVENEGHHYIEYADLPKSCPGLSRITENFRPEFIPLPITATLPADILEWKSTQAPHHAEEEDGGDEKGQKGNDGTSTIESRFAEEQAVTALEWNPNRHCAGWVAVGWASGLVRVMDLSHDAK